MEPKELAPGVMQYYFPKDVAEEIIARADLLPDGTFTRSEVLDNNKIQSVRTSEQVIFDVKFFDILSKVHDPFANAIDDYNTRYQSKICQVEGFTMLRYEAGGWYDTHTDATWMAYRVTSALIYLNPSNYDGGSTYFPLFDLHVKPEDPAIVLFPANYAYCHQAMPVKSGRKDVLVTWMNDLPEGLHQESMRNLLSSELVGV